MKYIRTFFVGLLLALSLAPQAFAVDAFTNYAQNKMIDYILRGQASGIPTSWYVALYTTCPTAAGGGVEVSGGSYARQAVTSSLANWAGTQSAGSTTASSGTSGTSSNNGAITFPTATGTWGTVNCWALTDAASAGNIWVYASVTTPPTITSGSTPSFAAAALTFGL